MTTQEQKLVLEPGEQVYYKDHQASVRNVDVEIYTAWMEIHLSLIRKIRCNIAEDRPLVR